MTNATKSKQRSGRQTKAQRRREQERRAARQRTVWVVVAVVAALAIVGAMLLSGGDDGTTTTAAPADAVSIEPAGGPVQVGDQIPAFSAPGLDGGTVSWGDFEGAPTVLVVWASWCPHCQAELPVLVPATQAREGVELVSITTAIGQNPGPTPQEFLIDEGLTLTTAVDDAADTLMQGLGVSSFPTVYYVSADGTVENITVGESPEGAIEANLDALQGA